MLLELGLVGCFWTLTSSLSSKQLFFVVKHFVDFSIGEHIGNVASPSKGRRPVASCMYWYLGEIAVKQSSHVFACTIWRECLVMQAVTWGLWDRTRMQPEQELMILRLRAQRRQGILRILSMFDDFSFACVTVEARLSRLLGHLHVLVWLCDLR